jgi:CheY-like chemotaxis protein
VAVSKIWRMMKDVREDNFTSGSRIDLVCMDNSMPKISGPLAAKQMREMGYVGGIIGDIVYESFIPYYH